jgi:hypothetical protein
MYCQFCSEFIGIVTLRSFCDRCDLLRRLYLINDKDLFVKKIKEVFLRDVKVLEEQDKKG